MAIWRQALSAAMLLVAACSPPEAPPRAPSPRPPRRAPTAADITSFEDGPGARAPAPGGAPGCGDTEVGFDAWLEGFRRRAPEEGLSPATVASALAGVTYDPEVVRLVRTQRAFKLSLEELVAKRVTPSRVRRGKALLRAHAPLLARVEARFGVPPEVVVAIWGLETDFGANTGSMSSLRALATLAYDCRRAPRFRAELVAALRLVQRGDLTAAEMVGAWAGELGQTQFLPSSYEAFGVDFDGDGRVDLLRSTPDVLASTAAYLQGHGWRPREPYGEGTANFKALEGWNSSELYRRTIVVFA